MRIISLNTWGGRALHPLLHFLKRYAESTDIFCLQEVHDSTREYRERRHPEEYVCPDLLPRIRTVLSGHDGYFARWADDPHRMSVALFIRHGVNVREYGTHTILWPLDISEEGSFIISPRKMQYVRVGPDNAPPLTVANYHGMWRSTGKRDTPERIDEMRTLAEVVRTLGPRLVLAGDFNLDPDTKALAWLMRKANLLTMMQEIPAGTRTPLFRHWGQKGYSQFADYAFWTSECRVRMFLMSDIASDHAPLCIDVDGWH